MHSYVTVSVRIPKDLRNKMRKLGIKPSKVLRLALEKEVKMKEAERLEREIEELKPVLDGVSVREIVKGLREDRRRG